MSANEMLRDLPSVDQLLRTATLAEWSGRVLPETLSHAARGAIERRRRRILQYNGAGEAAKVDVDEIARDAVQWLFSIQRPTLPAVINATGVVLHTGLGRAPLAPAAVEALTQAASSYTPVELDLETGRRGSRTSHVEPALRQLTGADAACVVNNNAAALVLSLAALAHGREVVVSRGELIEIGGGFRLPEIMAASGARLVEVGTTNRTRVADYQRAVGAETAALLKVHPSNYRISGFTEAADVKSLAAVARRCRLPLMFDIGSGVLGEAHQPWLPDEPDAAASLKAGADVVMFSGDKLLGGPQCGVIVGRREHVCRIHKHPLMRAFRVDKLTLAALDATLQIYLNPSRADELPAARMFSANCEELQQRATAAVETLRRSKCDAEFAVVAAESYAGGGAVPQRALESRAIRIVAPDDGELELVRKLRTGRPPVIGRVLGGAVWLDLRTVEPHNDEALIGALLAAL